MTTLQNELQELQADQEWIEQNRERLTDQYPDQWIAVRNRRVIANDPHLDALLRGLPDPAHTCIEYLVLQRRFVPVRCAILTPVRAQSDVAILGRISR